jgi:hypothetical protein
MTESQAISKAIKILEAKKPLDKEELMHHNELLRALESARFTLKEVANFGGISSLIQKASMVNTRETLFPELFPSKD